MKSILLIDDMKGIQDSLKVILKLAGYDIVVASNGKEGLEKIKTKSFSLIITDIMMPEVDGTEVIINIKKNNNVPVLAISGGGSGVSAEDALMIAAEKADAVLEKPFSKEQLLEKIESLVS